MGRDSPPAGMSWRLSLPRGNREERAGTLQLVIVRLGRLMRAGTIERILELCDEFTPGRISGISCELSMKSFELKLN